MDVKLWRAVWLAEGARRLGKGRRALTIVLGLSALPMLGLMVWVGLDSGRALPSLNALALGRGLASTLLGLGFLAGFWDGSCSLRFEPLRPFQVRPSSLFVAELLVALRGPLVLYLGGLAAAVALGMGLAWPRLLPWLVCFIPMLLLWLLTLERIVGALSRRLGLASLRLLVLYGLLFLGLCWLLTQSENRALPWLQAWRPSPRLVIWLPTTQVVLGWQGLLEGRWFLLRLLVYPLLWTAFLLGLAYWMLRDVLSGEAAQLAPTGSTRLWTFSRPWVGVAKQHWHCLWTSKVGRIFLFVPLIMLDGVIIPKVFDHRPSSTWIVGWLGYLLLTSGLGFGGNLFGMDRGGVRTFWTAPLGDRDLLVGKLVAVAAFQGLLVLLFMAGLPFLAPLRTHELLAAGCFILALFCLQARLGLRTSILNPRPRDPAGLKPNDMDDAFFAMVG